MTEFYYNILLKLLPNILYIIDDIDKYYIHRKTFKLYKNVIKKKVMF